MPGTRSKAGELDAAKTWRRYLLGRKVIVVWWVGGSIGTETLFFFIDRARAILYLVIMVVVIAVGVVASYRARRSQASSANDDGPVVWISRSSYRNSLAAPAFAGSLGWLGAEPFGWLDIEEDGLCWYPTPATVKRKPGIGDVDIPAERITEVSVQESRLRRGLVVRVDGSRPIVFVTSRARGADFADDLEGAGWGSDVETVARIAVDPAPAATVAVGLFGRADPGATEPEAFDLARAEPSDVRPARVSRGRSDRPDPGLFDDFDTALKRQRRAFVGLAAAGLLFGLYAAGYAGWGLHRDASIEDNGVRTVATLEQVVQADTANNDVVRVSFLDRDGQKINAQGKAYELAHHTVGDMVPVIYSNADPHHLTAIGNPAAYWEQNLTVPIVAGVLLLLVGIGGLGHFQIVRRINARPEPGTRMTMIVRFDTSAWAVLTEQAPLPDRAPIKVRIPAKYGSLRGQQSIPVTVKGSLRPRRHIVIHTDEGVILPLRRSRLAEKRSARGTAGGGRRRNSRRV